MEPWYKVATSKVKPEGCSFNPDEFADSLEQAVSGAEHIQNRDPFSVLNVPALPARFAMMPRWSCGGWQGKPKIPRRC
jgi:hypothetical protein